MTIITVPVVKYVPDFIKSSHFTTQPQENFPLFQIRWVLVPPPVILNDTESSPLSMELLFATATHGEKKTLILLPSRLNLHNVTDTNQCVKISHYGYNKQNVVTTRQSVKCYSKMLFFIPWGSVNSSNLNATLSEEGSMFVRWVGDVLENLENSPSYWPLSSPQPLKAEIKSNQLVDNISV